MGLEVAFRKRYLSVFNAIGAVVLGAFIVSLPVATHDFRSMGDILIAVAILSLLIYVLWLVGWHSAVRVGDGGVVVDNLFVRHEIPWRAFAGFNVEDGLAIRLANGGSIGSVVFGGSVIGNVFGYRYTRRMCDKMNAEVRRRRTSRTEPASDGAADRHRTIITFPILPLLLIIGVTEVTAISLYMFA